MVNAGLESAARGDQQGQTGYSSMMFHFTPYALGAWDDADGSHEFDRAKSK